MPMTRDEFEKFKSQAEQHLSATEHSTSPGTSGDVDAAGAVYITPGMKAEWWLSKPTGQVRWARGPNTSTEPDRLQQLWQHETTNGAISFEWRDVPVEVVPPPIPKEPAPT